MRNCTNTKLYLSTRRTHKSPSAGGDDKVPRIYVCRSIRGSIECHSINFYSMVGGGAPFGESRHILCGIIRNKSSQRPEITHIIDYPTDTSLSTSAAMCATTLTGSSLFVSLQTRRGGKITFFSRLRMRQFSAQTTLIAHWNAFSLLCSRLKLCYSTM